jgi:hemoglobin
MKRDISTREDIDLLLHLFYKRLLDDTSISYIFTDVVKIDMEAHIPVIGDFWEGILFERNTYSKNLMKIHLDIQSQTPLLKHHFDTWLGYFNSTIDELFEGSIAFKAKQRALSIATMMQIRIAQQKQ